MIDIKKLHQEALQRGVCSDFTGNETAEEAIRLFASQQGLKFCKRRSWPSLKLLKSIDKAMAKQAGVYVDTGDITLHNPHRVVLVGDTRATLVYDDRAEELHNIAVMYGSEANIIASNGAVVFVEKNIGGGVINVTKDDNSIVDVR